MFFFSENKEIFTFSYFISRIILHSQIVLKQSANIEAGDRDVERLELLSFRAIELFN